MYAPDTSVHAPSVTVPTPKPIATVVSRVPPGSVSTAEVSVTVRVPPLALTTNVLNELWRTPSTGGATVPVSTSFATVAVVVVVVVEDGEVELPAQADAATAIINNALKLVLVMVLSSFA